MITTALSQHGLTKIQEIENDDTDYYLISPDVVNIDIGRSPRAEEKFHIYSDTPNDYDNRINWGGTTVLANIATNELKTHFQSLQPPPGNINVNGNAKILCHITTTKNNGNNNGGQSLAREK